MMMMMMMINIVVIITVVVVAAAHATSRSIMPTACFQAFQGSYHMLSGFSGCSLLPKLSCCLPLVGWGVGGHDDIHCRLHHLQPFRLSGEKA